MRALAILGPAAQDSDLDLLKSAGLQVEHWDITDSRSLADLAVVFGGDGTIHRFLPQLLRAKLPVLLVPRGSGNDLARALSISSPQIATDLARNFVAGSAMVREIDVGIVTNKYGHDTPFCCVGGVGLDATAAEFANKMPRWIRGNGGYLLGMARALLQAPSLQLRICADGREIAQQSCLLSFANTPSFGGGLRIAPNANLNDGTLDCVLVRQMGRLKLIPSAIALLRTRHLELKQVNSFRAERLRIETDPPTWVYADGEPVCQTPIDVSVIPHALRLLSGT
ncbi:MAG TPA: diacylglycerol kinase family protein [Terriglobales bacterium]|jgi:diacylglycerol kinase (ATP)|nr:diacylglycerol kinase family protein [Terriglobales bacterium]